MPSVAKQTQSVTDVTVFSHQDNNHLSAKAARATFSRFSGLGQGIFHSINNNNNTIVKHKTPLSTHFFAFALVAAVATGVVMRHDIGATLPFSSSSARGGRFVDPHGDGSGGGGIVGWLGDFTANLYPALALNPIVAAAALVFPTTGGSAILTDLSTALSAASGNYAPATRASAHVFAERIFTASEKLSSPSSTSSTAASSTTLGMALRALGTAPTVSAITNPADTPRDYSQLLATLHEASLRGGRYCVAEFRALQQRMLKGGFELSPNTAANPDLSERDALMARVSTEAANISATCLGRMVGRWQLLEALRSGGQMVTLAASSRATQLPELHSAALAGPASSGPTAVCPIAATGFSFSSWFQNAASPVTAIVTAASTASTHFAAALRGFGTVLAADLSTIASSSAPASSSSWTTLQASTSLHDAAECFAATVAAALLAAEDTCFLSARPAGTSSSDPLFAIPSVATTALYTVPAPLSSFLSSAPFLAAPTTIADFAHPTLETNLGRLNGVITEATDALATMLSSLRLQEESLLGGSGSGSGVTTPFASSVAMSSVTVLQSAQRTLYCLRALFSSARDATTGPAGASRMRLDTSLLNMTTLRASTGRAGPFFYVGGVADCFDGPQSGAYVAAGPLSDAAAAAPVMLSAIPKVLPSSSSSSSSSSSTPAAVVPKAIPTMTIVNAKAMAERRALSLPTGSIAATQTVAARLYPSAFPRGAANAALEARMEAAFDLPSYVSNEASVQWLADPNDSLGDTQPTLAEVDPLSSSTTVPVCLAGYSRRIDSATGLVKCRECFNMAPHFAYCPGDDALHRCENRPITAADVASTPTLADWLDASDALPAFPVAYTPMGRRWSSPFCPFICRDPRFVRVSAMPTAAGNSPMTNVPASLRPALCPSAVQSSIGGATSLAAGTQLSDLCPNAPLGFAFDVCIEAPVGTYPTNATHVADCVIPSASVSAALPTTPPAAAWTPPTALAALAALNFTAYDIAFTSGGIYGEPSTCGFTRRRRAVVPLASLVSDAAVHLGTRGDLTAAALLAPVTELGEALAIQKRIDELTAVNAALLSVGPVAESGLTGTSVDFSVLLSRQKLSTALKSLQATYFAREEAFPQQAAAAAAAAMLSGRMATNFNSSLFSTMMELGSVVHRRGASVPSFASGPAVDPSADDASNSGAATHERVAWTFGLLVTVTATSGIRGQLSLRTLADPNQLHQDPTFAASAAASAAPSATLVYDQYLSAPFTIQARPVLPYTPPSAKVAAEEAINALAAVASPSEMSFSTGFSIDAEEGGILYFTINGRPLADACADPSSGVLASAVLEELKLEDLVTKPQLTGGDVCESLSTASTFTSTVSGQPFSAPVPYRLPTSSMAAFTTARTALRDAMFVSLGGWDGSILALNHSRSQRTVVERPEDTIARTYPLGELTLNHSVPIARDIFEYWTVLNVTNHTSFAGSVMAVSFAATKGAGVLEAQLAEAGVAIGADTAALKATRPLQRALTTASHAFAVIGTTSAGIQPPSTQADLSAIYASTPTFVCASSLFGPGCSSTCPAGSVASTRSIAATATAFGSCECLFETRRAMSSSNNGALTCERRRPQYGPPQLTATTASSTALTAAIGSSSSSVAPAVAAVASYFGLPSFFATVPLSAVPLENVSSASSVRAVSGSLSTRLLCGGASSTFVADSQIAQTLSASGLTTGEAWLPGAVATTSAMSRLLSASTSTTSSSSSTNGKESAVAPVAEGAFYGEWCAVATRVVDPPLRTAGNTTVSSGFLAMARAAPIDSNRSVTLRNFTVLAPTGFDHFANTTFYHRLRNYALTTAGGLLTSTTTDADSNTLITAADRNRAVRRLQRALADVRVEYVITASLFPPGGSSATTTDPSQHASIYSASTLSQRAAAAGYDAQSAPRTGPVVGLPPVHLLSGVVNPGLLPQDTTTTTSPASTLFSGRRTDPFLEKASGDLVIPFALPAATLKTIYETASATASTAAAIGVSDHQKLSQLRLPLWVYTRIVSAGSLSTTSSNDLSALRNALNDATVASTVAFEPSAWTAVTVFPLPSLPVPLARLVQSRDPALGMTSAGSSLLSATFLDGSDTTTRDAITELYRASASEARGIQAEAGPSTTSVAMLAAGCVLFVIGALGLAYTCTHGGRLPLFGFALLSPCLDDLDGESQNRKGRKYIRNSNEDEHGDGDAHGALSRRPSSVGGAVIVDPVDPTRSVRIADARGPGAYGMSSPHALLQQQQQQQRRASASMMMQMNGVMPGSPRPQRPAAVPPLAASRTALETIVRTPRTAAAAMASARASVRGQPSAGAATSARRSSRRHEPALDTTSSEESDNHKQTHRRNNKKKEEEAATSTHEEVASHEALGTSSAAPSGEEGNGPAVDNTTDAHSSSSSSD